MKQLIERFVRDEAGQDIIEYALLAAFISIVAATILQFIGTDVKSMYTKVQTQTNAAAQ
jgi:Flp pilus assembly pilin Flp